MIKKTLVPILILVVGIVGTYLVVRHGPEVETVELEPQLPLVRVQTARRQSVRLDVHSQGTVRPRTEADLVAEVSGRVVWAAAGFDSGGFFEAGDVLVRLDGRDYEVARTSARAQLAQAQVRLVREEAEAAVALEEWAELGEGDPGPLVRHEPQLAQARADAMAAEAAVEKAELDVERTEIRAPFRGRVRLKLADVGQFVSRGAAVAKVYAVDTAEVRLPIAADELAFLDFGLGQPGAESTSGPAVEVRAELGGRAHRWRGRIVRSEGEIDAASRMLPLVASFDDPYTSAGSEGSRLPLAVGLFVEAVIEGRTVDGAFVVPRSALRSENSLLVLEDGERLRSRRVEVLRHSGDSIVVGAGLEEGDRVCVSSIDAFVEGMRVRVTDEAFEPAAGVEAWNVDSMKATG